MSPKQCSLAILIVGVCLGNGRSSVADDAMPLKGSVRNGDNRPVAQEMVSIDQGGSYLTSNSGEFEFPLPDPHRIDSSAIHFHVRNWVVVKPCELQNGRAYVQGAAGFEITVYKRRDKRLVDIAQGEIYLSCVVQELASDFRIGKRSPSRSRTSTLPRYLNPPPWGARIANVAWNFHFSEASDEPDPLGRKEFTLKKAEEAGFSPEELAFALNQWAKSPGNMYHRGLAALYDGKYDQAVSLISDSIHSLERAPVGRYVALARAEFERGNSEGAESALREALKLQPTDAIVQADLDLVSGVVEKKATEGTQLSQPEGAVGGHQNPRQPTNYIEIAIITLVALVALCLFLYYVYRLLINVLEEDFNRRFRITTVEETHVQERREPMIIKPIIAAVILHSVYSAFRSVGGHPPERVNQMIQEVRGTQERPSSGMGA